jgi:hypothetical protein
MSATIRTKHGYGHSASGVMGISHCLGTSPHIDSPRDGQKRSLSLHGNPSQPSLILRAGRYIQCAQAQAGPKAFTVSFLIDPIPRNGKGRSQRFDLRCLCHFLNRGVCSSSRASFPDCGARLLVVLQLEARDTEPPLLFEQACVGQDGLVSRRNRD